MKDIKAPMIPGPETPQEFAAKVHLCSDEDAWNAYAAFDTLISGDSIDTLAKFAATDLTTPEIFGIIWKHFTPELRQDANASKIMCLAIEHAKRMTRI